MSGLEEALRWALNQEGYALVPTQDIDELRAHLEWGVDGNEVVALERIASVVSSATWKQDA